MAHKLWLITSLFRKFNSTAIQIAVSLLRPDNMQIFLESKAFENEVDQVEKWYSARYSEEKLDSDFLDSLKLSNSSSSFDIPSLVWKKVHQFFLFT